MNRHEVAKAIAAARRSEANVALLMGEDSNHYALNVLTHELAALLPPSQRDQFLIAAGVPR